MRSKAGPGWWGATAKKCYQKKTTKELGLSEPLDLEGSSNPQLFLRPRKSCLRDGLCRRGVSERRESRVAVSVSQGRGRRKGEAGEVDSLLPIERGKTGEGAV